MTSFKKRNPQLLKSNGFLIKTDPLACSGFVKRRVLQKSKSSNYMKRKLTSFHFSKSPSQASNLFLVPAEKKIARALFVELSKPKVIALEDIYCNVTRMFNGVLVDFGGKAKRPVTNYNVRSVLKKLIREGFVKLKQIK